MYYYYLEVHTYLLPRARVGVIIICKKKSASNIPRERASRCCCVFGPRIVLIVQDELATFYLDTSMGSPLLSLDSFQ